MLSQRRVLTELLESVAIYSSKPNSLGFAVCDGTGTKNKTKTGKKISNRCRHSIERTDCAQVFWSTKRHIRTNT